MLVHAVRKAHSECVSALKQALELNPHDVYSMLQLGLCYKELPQRTEAQWRGVADKRHRVAPFRELDTMFETLDGHLSALEHASRFRPLHKADIPSDAAAGSPSAGGGPSG